MEAVLYFAAAVVCALAVFFVYEHFKIRAESRRTLHPGHADHHGEDAFLHSPMMMGRRKD